MRRSPPFPELTIWHTLAALLALSSAIPLLVVASSWLVTEQAVWRHLSQTVLSTLLGNTLILAGGVGLGVVLLGTALAGLTSLCQFPGRRFFDWALMLPLAIPTYVLAFTTLGFLDLGSPLQSWLRSHFGPKLPWFPNVRSAGMVVLVLVLVLYPYVYMLARSAFRQQGQRLLEASRILGRGPWGAFFQAALPMARPAIAVGAALAIMESLADFGAVAVFGFDTFTTAIYKSWFGLFNLNAAAQLASLLLLFAALLLTLERRMRGKGRYHGPDQGGRTRPIRLQGTRAWAASAFCGLVFLLAFLLPMGQLLLWAGRRLTLDLDLRYGQLLLHTLLLGGIAALVTTAAALILGFANRRPVPGGDAAVRLATLGYALPGSVLAVGVMLSFTWIDRQLSGWVPGLVLTGSVLGLLLAYGVRFLAVAHGPVESGLARIRPSLEEAARTLGARPNALLKDLYLPMLSPSLLTALPLVLVEVMKEMPATLLLRPFGWDTLAVRIFEMTSEGEWERAALPAVTLVLAGLGPVILLVRRPDSAKVC
ncbi:MAG: iron ABC transporter permease [Magnetococcales bacterium]|nr:iron ABC transporter permease [Magnetococcales bacterium]